MSERGQKKDVEQQKSARVYDNDMLTDGRVRAARSDAQRSGFTAPRNVILHRSDMPKCEPRARARKQHMVSGFV